jgi:hypothetical protein
VPCDPRFGFSIFPKKIARRPNRVDGLRRCAADPVFFSFLVIEARHHHRRRVTKSPTPPATGHRPPAIPAEIKNGANTWSPPWVHVGKRVRPAAARLPDYDCCSGLRRRRRRTDPPSAPLARQPTTTAHRDASITSLHTDEIRRFGCLVVRKFGKNKQ